MLIHRVLATALLSFAVSAAQAEISSDTIRIGVLTDLSGPYAQLAGPGSVLAAQMAVEDFGPATKGMKVELVSADHKQKPDVGTAIAREWYEKDKVDMIVDIPGSAVALAVHEVTREKNKVLIVATAGTSDLTGAKCSPNTVHWTYDTWALANGTGSIIALTGGRTWVFLTADYAFGHALERDTEAAVINAGGKVLQKIRHPFPTQDFSTFLRQAQASKAQIIGLANAGTDTINAIKQGASLGITGHGQQFAGLLIFITDIHALGLETAQGLLLTSAFYWDLTPKTRAWSKRFLDKHKQMPTMVQAGVYAGVLHYLKAVEALRSHDDGAKVVAKMKQMSTDDPLFGIGHIRQDGRKIHKMYLFEVKHPVESKGPWDYYKLRGVIPANEAFRSEKAGGCPLVKK